MHAERVGIDQHQMIVRDADMNRLDAGPDRIAGRAAVGEQHEGRERRFVGIALVGGRDGAETPRDPAFVRQRALEVFADHAFFERRAGEQFVEGRALQSVQGGGGVRGGWQRERQKEMKSVNRHDARHCRAKRRAR